MDKKLAEFRERAKKWMEKGDWLSTGSLEPMSRSKSQHRENELLIDQVWACACAFLSDDIDEFEKIYHHGRLGRRGRAISAEFRGLSDDVISDVLQPEGSAKHPDGALDLLRRRDRFMMSSLVILRTHGVRGVYRNLSEILRRHGIKQAPESIRKKWQLARNKPIRDKLPQFEVSDVLLVWHSNFVGERTIRREPISSEDILKFLDDFWRSAAQELPERAKR